jgi:hypothetical protein
MKDGTLTICFPTLDKISKGAVNHYIYEPNMTLADENTSMVDTLGQTKLVNLRLQTTLHEIFNLERKHVIEFHARFVEHAHANETANEGVAFEETFGVFLIEGEEFTFKSACSKAKEHTYRAARRIFDRFNWTRHTSRLLRRPYSPTVFSSASLRSYKSQCTNIQAT